jgi:hypothetical protein
MNHLSSLIVGWSIAWGFCMVAISNLQLDQQNLFAVAHFEKASKFAVLKPALAYGVGIWAAGCVIILIVFPAVRFLVEWILGLLFGPEFRLRVGPRHRN